MPVYPGAQAAPHSATGDFHPASGAPGAHAKQINNPPHNVSFGDATPLHSGTARKTALPE
jgi:hypothetical protein